MDFAKRQMKNMGWSEGKGLGAEENGIVKPIVPNIQMDTRGLGFSIADSLQIKNQWWAEAYNVASKGLKPEYKITSVGVIVKTKSGLNGDENLEEKNEIYNQHFVSGGTILNKIHDDNNEQIKDEKCNKKKRKKKQCKEIDDKEMEMQKHEMIMIDEKKKCKYSKQSSLDFNVIYAKNDNITCHKAARLGIKMSGKMKRLQEQESKFSLSKI
ncbi:G patch domain-containing protein 4 [Dermatophagoides farinae]|uniref:G patch domain-containing protein 4 n=1 Tax=Dermatophagoides farinae TaxID=6954 RepID=A0A922HRA7_DERFA|nr:G patch domain-containing protein 4-like [Dermatophagoides farinae]KAH7637836.1 g patch domain and dexh-box containing protein [Dermatophagoides farinae]KAH9501298.1 G patch domain-containing protein 4 [Dermatophagoides farinae]